MSFRHSARYNDRHHTYDTMAKQLFNGFVRKTEQFRTKLAAGAEETIRQFCPTDEEMIQYTERWLADTREHRQLGYSSPKYIDEDGGDDKDDTRATESEMRYKMLNFLDQETFPMVEMFGQIDTHDQPTIIEDEDYGQLLDFPYQNSVAIYQKEMLDMITESGDYALHSPCRALVVRVLNDEVEKWMKKFVRKYIVRGHAI